MSKKSREFKGGYNYRLSALKISRNYDKWYFVTKIVLRSLEQLIQTMKGQKNFG